MGGQERGEEFGGAKLGSRRQSAERLGPKGGVEVEGVPFEHREVVAGGVVRPVEAKLRRVGMRLAGVKNGGKGIGQAWFGKSWELTGERARRVCVG